MPSSLVLILTMGFVVIWTTDQMTPLWITALPLILGLSMLMLALGAAVLRHRRLMGSAFLSAALMLPLSAVLSLLAVVAGIPAPVSLF